MKMPSTPALTAAELLDTPAGAEVNVAIEIDSADDGILNGCLIEPDGTEPFDRYHRTAVAVVVHWREQTKVVMGPRSAVAGGAPVWVTGVIGDDDAIDSSLLALLGEVASVEG
jgi:hypothetical protein